MKFNLPRRQRKSFESVSGKSLDSNLNKKEALEIFENKGYKLLVENVEWLNVFVQKWAVEDWFIHSDYSDLPKLGKNILHTECVKLLEPYINKIT